MRLVEKTSVHTSYSITRGTNSSHSLRRSIRQVGSTFVERTSEAASFCASANTSPYKRQESEQSDGGSFYMLADSSNKVIMKNSCAVKGPYSTGSNYHPNESIELSVMDKSSMRTVNSTLSGSRELSPIQI